MKTKKNKIKQLPGIRVTEEVEERIQRLAKRIGCDSVYQMMVHVTDSLLRYMDKDAQLDPELLEVIGIFERFEGWGKAAALTDVGQKWRVREAIYFVEDDKCKGFIPCWTKAPFFNDMTVTFNKQDILDIVMRRTFPILHRQLITLGAQLDTHTITETISVLLQDAEADEDMAELRTMFSDCNRHEWGREIEATKYKRMRNKQLAAYMNSQPTLFDIHEQGPDLQQTNQLDQVAKDGKETKD